MSAKISVLNLRRSGKRFGRRASPWINWVLLAATVFLGALIRVFPQKSPLWVWILWGLALSQLLQGIWKERQGKRRIQSDDFFKSYIALLTNAVGLMQDISNYSADAIHFTLQKTLQNAGNMVALYYEEHDKEKFKDKFNASIMLPTQCSSWLEEKDGKNQFKAAVRFFDANRSAEACATVLSLTCWAREPQEWTAFALPVDSDRDYLLPGAPRAYVEKQLQVISDTLASGTVEKEMPKQAAKAQRELRDYLEDNKNEFRSFFSLPLISHDKTVGVLNVQSKDVDILGVDNEHRDDLELCLRPFCALLASLIVRESGFNS